MFTIETGHEFSPHIFETSKLSIDDLIIKSLESIGFKNINISDKKISFKNWFKDPELESFQRRYGKGSIVIDSERKIRILSKDFISIPLTITVNLAVLILFNYNMIHNSKEKLWFIITFSFIIISYGISAIRGTRAKYKSKHQDLIREIEKRCMK